MQINLFLMLFSQRFVASDCKFGLNDQCFSTKLKLIMKPSFFKALFLNFLLMTAEFDLMTNVSLQN